MKIVYHSSLKRLSRRLSRIESQTVIISLSLHKLEYSKYARGGSFNKCSIVGNALLRYL